MALKPLASGMASLTCSPGEWMCYPPVVLVFVVLPAGGVLAGLVLPGKRAVGAIGMGVLVAVSATFNADLHSRDIASQILVGTVFFAGFELIGWLPVQLARGSQPSKTRRTTR